MEEPDSAPSSSSIPHSAFRTPHSSPTLRFGLVLFGRAIDHLPHFVVTLAELGRTGMGPQRVPFDIEFLDALAPSAAHPGRFDIQSLYDPATHELRRPARLITEADLLADPLTPTPPAPESAIHDLRRHYLSPLGLLPNAEEVRNAECGVRNRKAKGGVEETPSSIPHSALRTPHSLTVRFLTPTLIRSGSGITPDGRRIPAREIRDRPDLGTLARRLRDRLATLCAFFGEPWTGPDFARLGHLADEVPLVHSHTHWHHRTRRSTRTGHTHALSGLTGHATYALPTPQHRHALLPLLHFGEFMGVGKHAVWGNGRLEVEESP